MHCQFRPPVPLAVLGFHYEAHSAQPIKIQQNPSPASVLLMVQQILSVRFEEGAISNAYSSQLSLTASVNSVKLSGQN